jgi:hypothetical protein
MAQLKLVPNCTGEITEKDTLIFSIFTFPCSSTKMIIGGILFVITFVSLDLSSGQSGTVYIRSIVLYRGQSRFLEWKKGGARVEEVCRKGDVTSV